MTAMPRSPRSGRSLSLVALTMASVLIVAACAGDDADSTPVRTSPIATLFTAPPVETTAPPDETAPPTTQPVVSEPDAPVETAPATTEPLVTTTTEPLAIQELLLRGDGIGLARFGAAPEGVIDYVTSILGGNTSDTGWSAP